MAVLPIDPLPHYWGRVVLLSCLASESDAELKEAVSMCALLGYRRKAPHSAKMPSPPVLQSPVFLLLHAIGP